MLYNNFVVCMMTCAFFALLSMIDNQDWQYIILPIGIIIWGIFKFFDEDDREYLRRNGIDPDEYNAFFPDEYIGGYPTHTHVRNTTNNTPRRNGNTITWDENGNLFDGQTDYTRYQPPSTYKRWENPAYKEISKKCRRNFKITISEEEKDGKSKGKREPVLHTSSNNFGW